MEVKSQCYAKIGRAGMKICHPPIERLIVVAVVPINDAP